MAVDVRVTEQSGISIVALVGEVDLANATDLRNQIFRMMPETASGLVLDLSGVTYMDSRGVQLIFELAEWVERRHLKFRVVAPPNWLSRRIMLLSHVDATLSLDADITQALVIMQQSTQTQT